MLQNGGFSELVTLVVKENVALSAVDGYCTYVYTWASLNDVYYIIVVVGL